MRFFIFLIVAAVIAGYYYFPNKVTELFSFVSGAFNKTELVKPEALAEKAKAVVVEVKKEIVAPPPLRAIKETPQAFLTQPGTIEWTNAQRTSNGLPPLAINNQLNLAAEVKAKDMLSLQYFAHQSPAGAGPADLAKNFDYQYLIIGENLALGNFKDDQALVQAWMDSPGHRANILNSRYTEIGVAVLQGIYQGQRTWLAVQEFGRPLAICPPISNDLKSKIESNETEIDRLQSELSAKKQEIEESRSRGRGRGRFFEEEERVNEYNQLAGIYNNLLNETKILIGQYNEQVDKFNTCVAS